MRIEKQKQPDKVQLQQNPHVVTNPSVSALGHHEGGFLDPSSMMSNTKVTSGLRRKKTDAQIVDLTSGHVSHESTRPAPVPTAAGNSRKYSVNPQDRICELLLPWRLVDDHARSQSRDRQQSGNQHSRIPLNFPDYDDYIETWEPLLVEEIECSILKGLPENTKSNRCWTGTVNVFNASESKKPDTSQTSLKIGWHQVDTSGSGGNGSRDTISQNDLILLTANPIELPFTAQAASRLLNQPLSGQVHMLALVTDKRVQGVTVKVDHQVWMRTLEQLNQRCPTSSRGASSTVTIDTQYGKKLAHRMSFAVIDNLTSYWREFFSLHDIRSSRPPLLSNLLGQTRISDMPSTPIHELPDFNSQESSFDLSPPTAPAPPPKPPSARASQWTTPPAGITASVLAKFRQIFNDSQIASIKTATEQRHGITLIQGPPGTGKTTTIIGLLNALHLIEYHNYYELLLSTVLSGEGVKARKFLPTGKGPTVAPLAPGHHYEPWVQLVSRVSKICKPHILVTAPSNVAVDNIVLRIIERGFYDGNAQQYKPSILRLGKCEAVKQVSLEEFIEGEDKRLAKDDRRLAKQKIELDMFNLAAEIYFLQSKLLNLRIAFLSHPLPTGWEVRVAEDTSLPYWVDHLNQRAQQSPPAAPPPEPDAPPPDHGRTSVQPAPKQEVDAKFVFEPIDSSHAPVDVNDVATARAVSAPLPSLASISYKSEKMLPEFQFYAKIMCEKLEEIDRLKLKHTRCHASTNPEMFGGHVEARQAIESAFIESAHVVFSTINGAASPSLEMSDFQVTIVDEACQCTEPSMLVALRKKCTRCIMVGDPKQLPATIFSDAARQKGYDCSLFERLMRNGHAPLLLNVQYRMGPEISLFPNQQFYHGRLHDGANVIAKSFYPPYISCLENAAIKDALSLDPFLFFDLTDSSDEPELPSGVTDLVNVPASRSNPQEALLCLSILKTLLLVSMSSGGPGSVGVITPYQEQLTEIKRLFSQHGLVHNSQLGVVMEKDVRGLDPVRARGLAANSSRFKVAMQSSTLDIELNTVDGFQGKEKNFIIISCVRANDYGSIGFLNDRRRMNVALTRAKHGMYVVGNANTLQSNGDWEGLLTHAYNSNQMVHVQHAGLDLMQVLYSRKAACCDMGSGQQDLPAAKRSRVEEQEEGEELE